MKQKRNSIVRYLVVALLAAVFAAYSFGSATVSALSSNATEAQFAVSIWGEDGSGNPCDWDNSEQCTRQWDPQDSKAESCTSKGSGYSWFACAMSKLASGASVVLYGWVKDDLATDPKIFDNTAMKEGWKTMRNLDCVDCDNNVASYWRWYFELWYQESVAAYCRGGSTDKSFVSNLPYCDRLDEYFG